MIYKIIIRYITTQVMNEQCDRQQFIIERFMVEWLLLQIIIIFLVLVTIPMNQNNEQITKGEAPCVESLIQSK